MHNDNMLMEEILKKKLEIYKEALEIIAEKHQCVDNLLSHKEIALLALKIVENAGAYGENL